MHILLSAAIELYQRGTERNGVISAGAKNQYNKKMDHYSTEVKQVNQKRWPKRFGLLVTRRQVPT